MKSARIVVFVAIALFAVVSSPIVGTATAIQSGGLGVCATPDRTVCYGPLGCMPFCWNLVREGTEA